MTSGCLLARRGPPSDELELPAGFRFFPSDEELVVHYLSKKAKSQPFEVPIIAEVDLYKFNPWDLPEKALFGEKEWYFFSPRDRKYPNGSRPNRAAGCGYWKATGTDKPIVIGSSGSRHTVGVKKALVFYIGKAPKGDKTNWIMHEYRLADAAARAARCKGSTRLDDWVLCRIYKKLPSAAKLQAAAAVNEASARLGPENVQPRPYIDENLANGDGGGGGGGGGRPRLWQVNSTQAEAFAYSGDANGLQKPVHSIHPHDPMSFESHYGRRRMLSESHESSPVDSSVVDDDGVQFLLDSLPSPFSFSGVSALRQPYLPFSF